MTQSPLFDQELPYVWNGRSFVFIRFRNDCVAIHGYM